MLSNILKRYKNFPVHIKSTFWLTFSGALQKGIAFLTTPIFTRILTPEQYGTLNVYNSWFSIFLILVTLNLFYGSYNTAMVEFETDRNNYTGSMIGFVIFIASFITIIFVIFQNSFSPLFSFPYYLIFFMMLQIVFQAIINFWSEWKKFEYDYIPVVIVVAIIVVFGPTLSVIGIYLFPHIKVSAKIIFSIIPLFITSIVILIIIIRKKSKLFNFNYWKYAVLINLPLVAHYLSTVVLGQSDRIIIEKLVDKSSAGIYSVIYSLAVALTVITTALNQSITPKLYSKIKNQQIDETPVIFYNLFIIGSAGVLILILFGPELLYILAPKEYYGAVKLIPPIALSVIFVFMYQLFANFEFYYKKTRFIALVSIASAILNVVLNYLFIPIFGYFAAAYTTLLCYIIFGFSHYFYAKSVVKKITGKWNFKLTRILYILITITILSIFVQYLYSFTIIRYSFIVVIFFTLFFMKQKILSFFRTINNL